MFDVSLQQLLLNAAVAFLVAVVMGSCMTLASAAIGDPGPRRDGRLTVVPTRHLGALGFVCLLFFGAGWVRPVDVRASDVRSRPWRIVAVSLAGVGAAALLAGLALVVRPLALTVLTGEASFVTASALATVARVGIDTAILNLLPLPPLAAGLVWRGLTPPLAKHLERYERWIAVALVGLFVTNALPGVLRPLRAAVLGVLGY